MRSNRDMCTCTINSVATAPSPVERISSAKVPATGKGSPKAKVLALGTCTLVDHEALGARRL